MNKKGLSPTTKLSNDKLAVSTKDFGECIKYFQNAHRSLMYLNGLMNKLPYNQPLKIGNYEIRKNQLNKYSQSYIFQLGELRKMYSHRKKKIKNKNRTSNLFFVSDQLVEFYKNADLGNLDPGNTESKNLSDCLDILVNYRIATCGILTSLMSRYIDVNNLKSKNVLGRYTPDNNMLTCFKNTKYLLPSHKKNGEFTTQLVDISNREPKNMYGDKLSKLQDNISNSDKSVVDRLKVRTDKRKNQKLYTKEGMLYTTMMIINNFYRIPNSLLDEDELLLLNKSENHRMAKELQDSLSSITEWHKNNK